MSNAPSLLPPNTSPLERAVEQTAARLADLPAEAITDLWNVDACPEPALPWLAWSMSVDEWETVWPDSVKRDVIRNSPLVHRRKGTVWAVRHALAPLRVTTEISEWWQQQPAGTPGTFNVTAWANDNLGLGDTVLSPELAALMHRQITAAKPESAHYDLVMAARHDATLSVACAARHVTVARHPAQMEAMPLPNQRQPLSLAVAARHVTICRAPMEIQ